MADVPGLPNQIADELKAHRTEFDLENALWNGDVTHLERWPDYSTAGIDARVAALLDIATRAEAVPAIGTVERILEIDRYIGMPGQGCSYMLGRITIDELRATATRLGDRFDIRAFHDQVLATGSIPLGALRRTIEDWVELEVAVP